LQTLLRSIAVAVLFAVVSAGSAHADAIGTANFTISEISGPYAGDTFTGTFTYDATAAQSVWTPLLSFTTDLPPWAGATLTDPGLAQATYNATGGLYFFYAPGPVGNTDAFALYNSMFIYGTTETIASEFVDAGSGIFTLSAPVPTPEPSTFSLLLLGLGLCMLSGMKRMLQSPKISEV
jgi:hypothetical protein